MILAFIFSSILVLTTTLIHYEGLRILSNGLAATHIKHGRRKVLLAIFWIFLIHILEISLYAFAFWFGDIIADIGEFQGAREPGFFDYFYFSAEAFTTLGLGDIYPVGALRLLASVEPINGLLLIGWSTSFTFLAMQRYWFLGQSAADEI